MLWYLSEAIRANTKKKKNESRSGKSNDSIAMTTSSITIHQLKKRKEKSKKTKGGVEGTRSGCGNLEGCFTHLEIFY